MDEPVTEALTEEEYLRRYKARLIEQHNINEVTAEELTKSADFEDLRDSFATDPEGAADEAMDSGEDDDDDEEEGDLDEDDQDGDEDEDDDED